MGYMLSGFPKYILMKRSLYNRFIRPLSPEPGQAEREIVLNYLLLGILALSMVTLLAALVRLIVFDGSFHPTRLASMVGTLLFIIALYCLARYARLYRLVATTLTLLISLFGCLVASSWGVLNPDAILLFSLAVVMAGVLIGARYSLYVAGGLTAILLYIQHGESTGRTRPDLSWLEDKPIAGDIVVFAAILFVIALVSWLFNRQMELSLRRAERSEKALQRQKILLEIKAEKRAQQLEAAQLDKMQELYRFAELGRLSTALFHDLANHLSTVSLDIEGLSSKDQTVITQRISQNVGHIDAIVQRVRRQLRGKNDIEVFNIRDEINEVVKILEPAATQAGATVSIENHKSVKPHLAYKGDTVRFRQIILNLVSNGIEAYPTARPGDSLEGRTVTIGLKRERSVLRITVSDHGRGIPAKDRDKIFHPFYTTKQKGTGIGLFIVQQVVEHDFKGTIKLLEDKQATTFQVSLPKSYYAEKAGN